MSQPNTPIAQRRTEIAVVVMLLLVVPTFWLLVTTSAVSDDKERRAILRRVASLSPDSAVEVNGQKLKRPGRLIADLKRTSADHWNHAPGRRPEWYRIELKEGELSLILLLTRDQYRAELYWVFLPGVGMLGDRIGNFIDPELASFFAERDLHGDPNSSVGR